MPKIGNGVQNMDGTYALLNRRPRGRAHEFTGQWWEIDESTYDYFLGMLPPLQWNSTGFLMCEAVDDGLYNVFYTLNGRFFCSLINTDTSVTSTPEKPTSRFDVYNEIRRYVIGN